MKNPHRIHTRFRNVAIATWLAACGKSRADLPPEGQVTSKVILTSEFAAPSEDGWVVQVGLVNGIRKDKNAGWIDGMRYLPLINVGW